MLCSWYFYVGNLASSDALVRLSHQLTTAPDYLLKSSLLTTEPQQQLTDRTNTTLQWKESSTCDGSRTLAQLSMSSAHRGRSATFAKTENSLLTGQLASSLTENHLLKQLETENVSQKLSHTDRTNTTLQWKESSTYDGSRTLTQLSMSSAHRGRSATFAKTENSLLTWQLASSLTENHLLKQLETENVSQKPSHLCVTPSLISSTEEPVSDARYTAVEYSVPVEMASTLLESKLVKKQQKMKRRMCDRKGTSVVAKPKLKPVKKAKLAVPEQVDNDNSVVSYELPSYKLMHEDVNSEEVQMLVPADMAEQLLRPVVDVPAVKVVVVWFVLV